MATERKESAGNLAADGDTDTVVGRGPCYCVFDGTFGSGTITLYAKLNGAFVPVTDDTTDVTLTADGSKVLNFPAGQVNEVKGTLAGSSSPDLNYRIGFDRG